MGRRKMRRTTAALPSEARRKKLLLQRSAESAARRTVSGRTLSARAGVCHRRRTVAARRLAARGSAIRPRRRGRVRTRRMGRRAGRRLPVATGVRRGGGPVSARDIARAGLPIWSRCRGADVASTPCRRLGPGIPIWPGCRGCSRRTRRLRTGKSRHRDRQNACLPDPVAHVIPPGIAAKPHLVVSTLLRGY